jgi:BMFP domain-containing protein YqiC
LRLRRTIAIVKAHGKRAWLNPQRRAETIMVQTTNRFFDEVARVMNDAAGVAQGVRREFDTLFRTQAERILRDLDVVKRDDFEAVKEMARIAREENEALKARVSALETALAARGPASAPPSGPAEPLQTLDLGGTAGPGTPNPGTF